MTFVVLSIHCFAAITTTRIHEYHNFKTVFKKSTYHLKNNNVQQNVPLNKQWIESSIADVVTNVKLP